MITKIHLFVDGFKAWGTASAVGIWYRGGLRDESLQQYCINVKGLPEKAATVNTFYLYHTLLIVWSTI